MTPADALREKVKKLDAACPCRYDWPGACGGNCRCMPHSLRSASVLGNDPCKHEHHALVREVARKAAEWGFDDGLYVYGGKDQVAHYTTEMQRELTAILEG